MKNYFKDSEFACKCGGCESKKMDQGLVGSLNIARHFADIPFSITSGYRCEVHNKAVGGKSTSSHVKGLAVDIHCVDSHDRHTMIIALKQAGFSRIGIAKNFIHVDVDATKPRNVIWVY